MATMESVYLKAQREPVPLAEFARELAARKAELGLPDPPRNAGTNRTESKRALLEAIRAVGGRW